MTTTALPEPQVAEAGVAVAPAGVERRFYAFVLDRLLLWSLYAAVTAAAYAGFLRDDRWLPGAAVIAVAVLLLVLASAVVLGRWGVSAGKAALGLRVLDVQHGRPVGVRRALVRTLLSGLATVPTFGFGAAGLAWTAVADPSGRRRGWHDRQTGSWVVDVRPPARAVVAEVEEPPQVVNLTTLRLLPAPTPPLAAPTRAPVPAPALSRPRTRWRVRFDSGEELDVEGPVLVGRGPEPRAGEPLGTLLALASSDVSLSKTHAQLQVVPDGALVVVDRGSTNGSVLVRGGFHKKLQPWRPATLKDGDRVRFGDREMTVDARPAPQ
jgi:uncharacterized RDD family membrane protein YckC